MSYSGVRGSSVGGVFGRFGGFTVSAALMTAVFLYPLSRLTWRDNLWLLALGYALSLVIAVVMHEAGHLLVGMAVGEPARMLRIGSGATLIGFRLGHVVIQVCTNPLSGGVVYFSSLGSAPGARRLASYVAGPAVNLIAAAYAYALWHSGVPWLGVFALAHADAFIASAVPSLEVRDGQVHRSDGLQIWNLLFRPAPVHAYFDGADISDDARAVLVRAVESARFSGAAEVTDLHLLRALAQDPGLQATFRTAGVDRKLPPAPTPESDDMSAPRWSRTANAILAASIRKSRDLGNHRPNPAGLCLGLLSVECSASQLLKDSGITEESLRALAAVEAEDQGSMRQEQVISADLPLERWGTAADAALTRAYKIAAADHSGSVGTNHILAALISDPSCRAARTLANLRFRLVWRPGERDDSEQPERLLLSTNAALAVAGAMWRTGPSRPAGTAELCLGIIDQNAGLGAHLLVTAGVSADDVVKALRYTEPEVTEAAGCTPSIRQMWERRAFARIRAERWMDARSDFVAVEKSSPDDRSRGIARNNIAWASLLANDPALRPEALELTESARALAPDLDSVTGTHAFALLENGSPAEAAALLEPIAATRPRARDRASELYLLAMCYARMGRLDEAAQKRGEAQAADPKCPLRARAEADATQQPAAPVS